MTRLFCRIVLAALVFFAVAEAQAHPHVWVTMKSELVYAADGTVTGVRHNWTFDDMFSTFATQGLESKEKGKFTREELAPLAQVNVESLKEFDYFTDNVLTLHFTLPFKTPAKAQSIDVEMYDPTWFVDFSFAEKEPVKLVGAPAECKISFARPGEAGTAAAPKGQPGEAFFNNLDPSANYGAQFANKIAVKCP